MSLKFNNELMKLSVIKKLNEKKLKKKLNEKMNEVVCQKKKLYP